MEFDGDGANTSALSQHDPGRSVPFIASVTAPKKWTVEQSAEMSRMWYAGDTAAVIGKALGYSRSAILGKKWRMGLADREIDQRFRVARPRTPRVKAIRRPKLRLTPRLPAFYEKSLPEPSIDFRCDFFALTDLRCKYPYGDNPFTFCGAPSVDHASYCAHHAAKCFSGFGKFKQKI